MYLFYLESTLQCNDCPYLSAIMGSFQLIYTAHIYRDIHQHADIKKDQNGYLVF